MLAAKRGGTLLWHPEHRIAKTKTEKQQQTTSFLLCDKKRKASKKAVQAKDGTVSPGAAAASGAGVGVAGYRSGCIIWEMDSMIQVEWLQCDSWELPDRICKQPLNQDESCMDTLESLEKCQPCHSSS